MAQSGLHHAALIDHEAVAMAVTMHSFPIQADAMTVDEVEAFVPAAVAVALPVALPVLDVLDAAAGGGDGAAHAVSWQPPFTVRPILSFLSPSQVIITSDCCPF